jgi:hypothetical protein
MFSVADASIARIWNMDCDPNSISILIVCGRVLQFTFDWMFVDGHGPLLLFLQWLKVIDDRPHTLDFQP